MRLIRFLFEHLIDYAGLFPPAELPMADAMANYAAYRQSERNWMLGRFIVPVARLAEFEQTITQHSPAEAWQLSALGGADLSADLARINQFNQQHQNRAVIETIEFKASTSAEIEAAAHLLQANGLALTSFIEIPIGHNPTELIQAIGAAGLFAKVRTGGVTVEGFPSTRNLARFIWLCANEDVGFKATAGLHHPLRATYPLTYNPDSASALMHGFLNVFLAAAFAQNGMGVEQLTGVLEEQSFDGFRFEQDSIFWHDQMLVVAHIRNMRSLLAIAFGSCSFTEPVEDLQRLHLL